MPEAFRTPASSMVVAGSATNASEEHLRGILQSIYEQTGESDKTFFGLCGTGMKKAISEFTLFSPRTNNLVISNRDTDDNRLSAAVDIIESDFGTIALNLSSFLGKTLAHLVLTIQTKGRIICLFLICLSLSWHLPKTQMFANCLIWVEVHARLSSLYLPSSLTQVDLITENTLCNLG